MRTLWRLACHNTPGEGLVPATVMNMSELKAQTNYHLRMTKFHQKTVDHHIEKAQLYIKRAEKLKKKHDVKVSKEKTEQIIEALSTGKLKIE